MGSEAAILNADAAARGSGRMRHVLWSVAIVCPAIAIG